MLSTSIAWKNGQWLPLSEVHFSLDDWGVLQGATIVDRLRTIDSYPLDVALHMQRLTANCEAIGIHSTELDQLGEVIIECARHNQSRLPDRDFSLVVLVTPGQTSVPNSPTIIVHVQPLKWTTIRHWYQHGQPLVIASNRNVPRECWSPQLKTRSRLQYYLADQQALQISGVHAGAILLNTEGYVTETSAANIVVVDQAGNLYCPPEESILGGVSLIRTLRLAEAIGLKILRCPISLESIVAAREVILTGTSACIWSASQVGNVHFRNPTDRPVYRELLTRWIADVGFDFCKRPA
ncbi:MAG: aminotransferase class IV [Pirellulaceae bacterium]|nr:aminotransferase class IV [Pirellulaceae bacterium]